MVADPGKVRNAGEPTALIAAQIVIGVAGQRFLACGWGIGAGAIEADFDELYRAGGPLGKGNSGSAEEHGRGSAVPYDPLHGLGDLSGVRFKSGARRSGEQVGLGSDCKGSDQNQGSVYAHEYFQP